VAVMPSKGGRVTVYRRHDRPDSGDRPPVSATERHG